MGDGQVYAVVIPSYKAKNFLPDVILSVPSFINHIVVVDDKCPENTGKVLQEKVTDSRVTILFNEKNLGVGGATLNGFAKAFSLGADVAIKIDADGQIDPNYCHDIKKKFEELPVDYIKGSRFLDLRNLKSMPRYRIVLNSILSVTNKFASGYYHITDPTNGLLAIKSEIFNKLASRSIAKGFFFESDMLYHLNLARAKVIDISMNAKYGDEKSNLNPFLEAHKFAFGNLRNFVSRIFLRHFIVNFHLPAMYLIFGLPLFGLGAGYGLSKLLYNLKYGLEASPGEVILPAVLVLISIQMIMHFFLLDVADEPK